MSLFLSQFSLDLPSSPALDPLRGLSSFFVSFLHFLFKLHSYSYYGGLTYFLSLLVLSIGFVSWVSGGFYTSLSLHELPLKRSARIPSRILRHEIKQTLTKPCFLSFLASCSWFILPLMMMVIMRNGIMDTSGEIFRQYSYTLCFLANKGQRMCSLWKMSLECLCRHQGFEWTPL